MKKKLVSNVKIDPKSFYAYVRSKSKTQTSEGLPKNEYGVLISDDLEMIEIWQLFEQVFKGDLSSNLTDIVITPEVVLEKLKRLKNNKVSGTDGLISIFSENIWNHMFTFKYYLQKSWCCSKSVEAGKPYLLFLEIDLRIMRVITDPSV